MSALAALIRDLHKPDHTYTPSSHPVCRGCDFDGYECEPPSWPCSTAALVYTADEISAVPNVDLYAWRPPSSPQRLSTQGITSGEDR